MLNLCFTAIIIKYKLHLSQYNTKSLYLSVYNLFLLYNKLCKESELQISFIEQRLHSINNSFKTFI
jgi:hypothetical protein